MYQIAVDHVLAHVRLLHQQVAGRLAGHGQCVIRFIPLLSACTQDAQQIQEDFASFITKANKTHKQTLSC